MVKKYINFEIFDRSRHRLHFPDTYFINAHTLILEKDFRWKRKKIFVIQKLHDLIGKTGSFRIPLNVNEIFEIIYRQNV